MNFNEIVKLSHSGVSLRILSKGLTPEGELLSVATDGKGAIFVVNNKDDDEAKFVYYPDDWFRDEIRNRNSLPYKSVWNHSMCKQYSCEQCEGRKEEDR